MLRELGQYLYNQNRPKNLRRLVGLYLHDRKTGEETVHTYREFEPGKVVTPTNAESFQLYSFEITDASHLLSTRIASLVRTSQIARNMKKATGGVRAGEIISGDTHLSITQYPGRKVEIQQTNGTDTTVLIVREHESVGYLPHELHQSTRQDDALISFQNSEVYKQGRRGRKKPIENSTLARDMSFAFVTSVEQQFQAIK